MFHCPFPHTEHFLGGGSTIAQRWFSLSLRPSSVGVHSPSCPLGPGATGQGLKCIVAAAKSSTGAGCTLGEVAGFPCSSAAGAVFSSKHCGPMSWSHWDLVLPHKSWATEPLVLDSPLPWAYSAREEPAFVTAQQTPPCITAV